MALAKCIQLTNSLIEDLQKEGYSTDIINQLKDWEHELQEEVDSKTTNPDYTAASNDNSEEDDKEEESQYPVHEKDMTVKDRKKDMARKGIAIVLQ